jgi:hypothetical protein
MGHGAAHGREQRPDWQKSSSQSHVQGVQEEFLPPKLRTLRATKLKLPRCGPLSPRGRSRRSEWRVNAPGGPSLLAARTLEGVPIQHASQVRSPRRLVPASRSWCRIRRARILVGKLLRHRIPAQRIDRAVVVRRHARSWVTRREDNLLSSTR